MYRPRVIPCLLLRNGGLVKTVRFRNPVYVGDPINTVKIFNEKEVDELVVLDITATREGKAPPFEFLAQLTDECFMPLCYGGGVRTIEHARTLFTLGVEKVAVNSYAVENPDFVSAMAEMFGRQSIIVSIDVRRRMWGAYEVVTRGATRRTGLDPVRWAVEMERRGAGELLLTSVDRDGTMSGYDLPLTRSISSAVNVPVVACGGAAEVSDLVTVVSSGGASAAAAASMFVFQGPNRAVLISYPNPRQLHDAFAVHS